MKRVFTLLPFVLFMAASVATGLQAQTPERVDAASALKAVIHVNFQDPERQQHALNNVENILKAAGDTQLLVVCHGEGIGLVTKKDSKQSELVQELIKKGVRFAACENTMKKKSLTKEDLLAGITTVPSGAVEIIRKQRDGYSYFKP